MYLVKFGAEWCQPCQKLEPQLATLVEEREFEIYDVDVDEMDAEVLREWGISSVPVMFVMDENDAITETIRGAVNPQAIVTSLEV